MQATLICPEIAVLRNAYLNPNGAIYYGNPLVVFVARASTRLRIKNSVDFEISRLSVPIGSSLKVFMRAFRLQVAQPPLKSQERT